MSADQVQQQVERPLELLEEDFQRVRRDVQVLRQLEQQLAVDLGDRSVIGRRVDGDSGHVVHGRSLRRIARSRGRGREGAPAAGVRYG